MLAFVTCGLPAGLAGSYVWAQGYPAFGILAGAFTFGVAGSMVAAVVKWRRRH